MKKNMYSAFAPIGLKLETNQPGLVIGSLLDAARVLIEDWPLDDGEDYIIAVKACADAIAGKTSPEDLRQALLRAAREAGGAALSLVYDASLCDKHAEPLRGQGGSMPL